MSQKIRLPSINAPTDKEKLEQIRSYLFQLANQLNWLLSGMDTAAAAAPAGQTQEDIFVLYAQLRPLLIRSADILDAYREQLKSTFAPLGEFTALHQAVDGVYMRSVTADKTGTLTVDCGLTDDIQLVFLSGWVHGAAVRETVQIDFAGGLSQSASLPLHGQEGGKFTLPVLSGDRLILISDGPFTYTIN